MSRMSLVGIWLLVVVAATMLTWQIVSAADDRVTDRPSSLNVAAPAISSLTTLTTPSSASGDGSATPPETTGTAGQTTTTTTSGEPGWQTKSIQTVGGTIVVRYTPGQITYQAATPGKGFHVEVEQYGPPEVEVKFRSADSSIEVHLAWSDDGIDVDISGPEGD